jgi:hypothetical protein
VGHNPRLTPTVFGLQQLKNSNPVETGEFLYGTYQTFATQMWLGAQVNCQNSKPLVQRFECRASIRRRRIAHGDSNRTSRFEIQRKVGEITWRIPKK